MRDDLSELRIRILEKVARGEPAEATLTELCGGVERMVPGAVVGVTVLDRAARIFERAIFPSIPDAYAEAIKGARVAERPGSCALAVYQGSTVVSDDIAADARFQGGWKALHSDHGIVSIQSRPLCAQDGASLGTLVVGFRQPRALAGPEEDAVAAAVDLACLALQRRRAQEQHDLLVGELQHRTRNLFSAIGSVVHATLKAHSDPGDFRAVFDGRLAALARAHGRVLEAGGADLRSLIADILAPYGAERDVRIGGPAFILAPEAAVAFSLAMHELATNAARHGAFSIPEGSLDVAWTVAREEGSDGGELMLELTWRESGGPAVTPPRTAGFGRQAIERSLASTVDGSVALDFRPEGLLCTIRAPLTARLGSRTN